MPKENSFSRRDSLKAIAAGTALVGGSTLVPSTLADEQTENETETNAETDTESETEGDTENETDVDPNAIELIAACVDDGRQLATFRVDNGNDVAVTLTADGAPVLGHGESGDEEYGAEPIERINAILSDFNERLENVENVEPIDEITDDTADELRSEILTQIVAEINVQSQEILGEDLADDVSTPDEARAEAQKIKEEYGVAAQEAVDALNEAADAVEAIRELAENGSTDGSGNGDGEATVVDAINDGAVATANQNVEKVNARLDYVETVEKVAEVEAETPDEADRLENEVDRLQDDIFTQMVAEINVQSQEILGEDLANDVSTPDEAREEGEKIKEEYGAAAQEAVDALNEAADAVEAIRAALGDAADTLRGEGNESANGEGDANDGESDENADEADGGLTVDPNASLEMRVGLDSDDTATVSLYHEDEEVTTETADADTLPGCGC